MLSPQQTRRNRKLFAIALAAAGVVLILSALRIVHRQYAIMESWPRVNATVLSSRLAQKDTYTASKYLVTAYWPVVEVKYEVGGTVYDRQASYAAKSDVRADWQPVVAELKPGSSHLLPYDPDHPDDIIVGAHWNLAHLGLAAALLVPGIVLLLIGLVVAINKPGSGNRRPPGFVSP